MALDLSRSLLGHVTLVNELITARLEPAMRATGLNVGAFELLSAVRAGKNQLTQIELAQEIGVTAPSLCEAVQNAVRRGFVEQVADPVDRRKKRIVLTAKGDKAIQKVLAELNGLETEVSARLDAEEFHTVLRALRDVAETLGQPLRSESKA